MTTFDGLMQSINQATGDTQRDRGTMFEEVVKSYLLNESTYRNIYDQVWMLNEVSVDYGISKEDAGVNSVARYRNTGRLTAVQVKYYKNKVGKTTINSYVAELNKRPMPTINYLYPQQMIGIRILKRR